MFFLYIIKSKTYNYHNVGSTKNLEKRLGQHNSGEVRSTRFRKPYDLVYTEEFTREKEARQREREIKSSRFEKSKIIKSITAPSSIG